MKHLTKHQPHIGHVHRNYHSNMMLTTGCKFTIKQNFTVSMLFALLKVKNKTLTSWPGPLVEGRGTAAIQSDAMATETGCCCSGEKVYTLVSLSDKVVTLATPANPANTSHVTFIDSLSFQEVCQLASRHSLAHFETYQLFNKFL